MRILMVCLGNICRSPLAEGIMRQKIAEAGLPWEVDSAGTGHWHAGQLPDPRSIAVAQKNGIDITYQRARQFRMDDFDRFDLILTMDGSNYNDVVRLAPEHRHRVNLILEYNRPGQNAEVPDPYYDDDGFDAVFQMLDEACKAVIDRHTTG